MVTVKRYHIVFFILILHSRVSAGIVQDIYQATYDMHDQFAGTTTQVQMNTYVEAVVLRTGVDTHVQDLRISVAETKDELLQDVLTVTGTAGSPSIDPIQLPTKEAIDLAPLTVYELLKTILLKLNQMAPS